MTDFKGKRLKREVVEIHAVKSRPVSLDNLLDDYYSRSFHKAEILLESHERRIICIHTLLQDYKKLSLDLWSKTDEWADSNRFYIDSHTSLDTLWDRKMILGFARRAGLIRHGVIDVLLKFLGVTSLLSSMFSLLSQFFKIDTQNIYRPYLIFAAFALLGGIFLMTARIWRDRQYTAVLEQLQHMEEKALLSLLEKCDPGAPLFADRSLLLIENMRNTSTLIRCFLLYSLQSPPGGSQLWCILDDRMEGDCIKRERVNGILAQYRLQPIPLEKRREIYQRLGLQHEISEEYLNFVGIDRLFAKELGDYESRDYTDDVTERIRRLISAQNYGEHFIRACYCLACLSVKLGYSLSLKNMVRLICTEGENKKEFIELEKKCRKNIGADVIPQAQMEEFLRKLKDALPDYICLQNEIYQFSGNVLKCLEQEFKELLPSENTTRKWILIKLLCNREMFDAENYFFDCCNLLLKVEFSRPSETVTMSLRLLDSLNKNYCWFYYPGILRHLDRLTLHSRQERLRYIKSEAVREAVISNRLLIADEESITLHQNYLSEYAALFPCGFEELVPASCMNMMDMEIENKEVYYRNMMRLKDPTARYYQLLNQLEKIICSNSLFDEGDVWEDNDRCPTASIPAEIGIILLSSLLAIRSQSAAKELTVSCRRLHEIAGLLHTRKYYTCTIMETIVREFYAYLKSGCSCEGEDVIFRMQYLGAIIENTNSVMLRFLYDMLINCSSKAEEYYDIRNAELALLHHFDFYNRNPFESGITNYLISVVESNFDRSIKIRILSVLLCRRIPNPTVAIDYLLDNRKAVLQEILAAIESASGLNQLEDKLVGANLLIQRIDHEDFARIAADQIPAYVLGLSDPETEHLAEIVSFILLREPSGQQWTREELIDISNQLVSKELALYFFAKCCQLDPELLQLLPSINGITTAHYQTTVNINLVSLYLKNCPTNDYDLSLLNYYLNIMRSKRHIAEELIQIYLDIVDRYDGIIPNLKRNEMETYSFYQARLIYLECMLLHESTVGQNPDRQLLIFSHRLIDILKDRLDITCENSKIVDVFQKGCQTDALDNYIIDNIWRINAVTFDFRSHLSAEYALIINYLKKFPDSYALLLEKYGRQKVDLLLNGNLIQLLDAYIELIEAEHLISALNYLNEAKKVLNHNNRLLQLIGSA